MAELPFFFQQVLENSRLMDIETAGLDPTRFTPISAAMKRYGAEGDPTTTWFQFQTAKMTRQAPHRKYGRIRAAKPPMEPFAEQQWLKEWSLKRSEFLAGGGQLTKPSQYFTRMFEQLGSEGGFLWVHNANFDISQFASEFATPGSVRNLYEGMAVPPFREFAPGRSRIWPTQTRQAFQFRGIARRKPGSTFGAMRGWYGEYRTMIEQASIAGKPAVLDTMFISQAMMSMAQQQGAMRTTYDVFTGARLEALHSAFGFGKYAAHGAGADVAAMEKLMRPLIETTEALYAGAPLRGRQAEALFRLGRMQPRLAEQNVTAMFAQAQQELRETGRYRFTTRGGVQRYSKSYEDLLSIYAKRHAGYTYDLPLRDIWSRMGAAKDAEISAVLAAKRTIPALRPLEQVGAKATYLKAEMMAALRGANPILMAGMAAGAAGLAYALLPSREDHNTVEGLSHRGIAQDTRHLITDFGGMSQMWKGMSRATKGFFGGMGRRGGQAVGAGRKALRRFRFGQYTSPIFAEKEILELAELSKRTTKEQFGKRVGVSVVEDVAAILHPGAAETIGVPKETLRAFAGHTTEEVVGQTEAILKAKGITDPKQIFANIDEAMALGIRSEHMGVGGKAHVEKEFVRSTVSGHMRLQEVLMLKSVKDVPEEIVAMGLSEEVLNQFLMRGAPPVAAAEEAALREIVRKGDPERAIDAAMGGLFGESAGMLAEELTPGELIAQVQGFGPLGEEFFAFGQERTKAAVAQGRAHIIKQTGAKGWAPFRQMIESYEEVMSNPEQLDFLTKSIILHEGAERRAASIFTQPAFRGEAERYQREAFRTMRTSQGLTHEMSVVAEERFLRATVGEEGAAYKFWRGLRIFEDPYYKGYGSFPATGSAKTIFGRQEGLRHEGLMGFARRVITDFGSGFLSKLIPMFSGARLSKLAQAAEGMAAKGWGKLLGVEVVPSMAKRFPSATRAQAASGLGKLPGAFYHPSEEVLVGKHRLEQATGLITKEAVAPVEHLRPEMVSKAVVEERFVEKSLGKEMADIKELTNVKNISAQQLESELQSRWYTKLAKGAPEDVTARFYELKGGDPGSGGMLKFFQEMEGGEAHIAAAAREARKEAALGRAALIKGSATPGRGWKQYRETFELHAKVAADPRQSDILNKSIILHEAVERRAAQMYADPAFEGVLKEYLQGQKAIPIHKRSQGIGHELAIAHEERFLREAVGEQAPAYQLIGRIRQQMGDAYYKGFRFNSKTTLGEIKGFRDEGLGKGIRQLLTEFGSGYRGLVDMPGSKIHAATSAAGKLQRVEQIAASRPSMVADEQRRIQRMTMNTMAEYAPDGVKRVRDFQSPHLSNNNGEGMPQRMFRMRRGSKRMYQP